MRLPHRSVPAAGHPDSSAFPSVVRRIIGTLPPACNQVEDWRNASLERTMTRRFPLALAAALIGGGWLNSAAQAQSEDAFFRNRRELIFITSSAPGGGYDSYSRLLSRHMTKYLPGNPRIVVQNMLGGGGVRATNFLYNVAAKDGSYMGLVDRGMPTAPLLYGERSQTKFDAVKFTWLGSLMRETGMGVITTRS